MSKFRDRQPNEVLPDAWTSLIGGISKQPTLEVIKMTFSNSFLHLFYWNFDISAKIIWYFALINSSKDEKFILVAAIEISIRDLQYLK